MRLHTMTLTAFGPFAGTEIIDFDALTERGLFLLHGPTGAGKTSVLDAVCFALYGVVPGARQQAARLRSDHADPDTPTQVVLEATLRGRRLRLHRSPAWERPKRRGSGSTREQPRVVLEELDCPGAAGRVLSTRLDEAGQLVRSLLGMSAEQFCQVVLLPQGQFAEFLRAGAEARRPLLEQLFGTARFSAAEAWLAEQRRAAYRELEQARAQVTHLVARVVEVAGLASAPEDVDDEVALAWSEQLVAAATEEADAARRREARAVTALERAQLAADTAAALADRQQRHRAATARATQLAAERPARARLAAELDAARRAAALVPALEAAVAQASRATAAAAAQAGARAALDERHRRLPPSELRAAAGAWRDELAVLAELAAAVDVEQELAARGAELLAQARRTGAAAEAVAADLEAIPTQRAALEAALHDAGVAQAEVARLAGDVALLEGRLAAARRRDELEVEQDLLAERVREATDTAQQARERWLDLRECRLDGMAAELAAELAAGDCCPVCGAADHPCPAAPAQGAVTLLEEQAAEGAAADADAERGCRAQELGRVQVELAGARARAGVDSVASLAAAHRGAASAQDIAIDKAARRPHLERQLGELDRRAAQWRDELTEHLRRRERAGAAAAAVGAQRADLAEKLRGARGGDPSIAARRERLADQADAAERAADAAVEADRARADATHAAAEAARRATAAGFDDLVEASRAVRCAARADELERELLEGSVAEQAVAQTLADPSLIAAGAAPPADVEAARHQLAVARQAHTEAAGMSRGAVAAAQRLERLTVDLAARLDAVRPLRTAHDVVAGLSALAEGTSSDNQLRMRLSAYVLAARLEQVAVAASERLQRMSGGRYTLVHTDEHAGGRTRSGLGLHVCDEWTGVRRDPVTLSGGESFFAALALALGLADVVAAESGGVALETLFVDEGFGSLDDDTLEEVMDVLDGLRAGGRAVGVVSHVGDLRSRIPAQLEVHKGRRGSSITLAGVSTSGVAAGAA